MDLIVLALSAVVGFAAGFAWVYTRNPFAGIGVVGLGAVVLFGAAVSGSPGSIFDGFVSTVGAGGFLAAVMAGVGGAVLADRLHRDQAS